MPDLRVGSPAEGHVRPLDGLRAIAVAVVMATHFDVPHFGGGQLGVDLFFVLSGFLITSLIIREHDRHGGVAWRAFYARRALRLLPALWLAGAATMVMVWATAASITPAALASIGAPPDLSVVPNTVGEVAIAFAYVADLPQSRVDHVFFGHAWSLSLEEQFYLVMPLVWFLARRRHLMGPGVLLVAYLLVGGARVAGLSGPLDLLQLRIDALLLGCLLASARRVDGLRPRLDRISTLCLVPALVGFALLVTVAPPSDASVLGRLGFTAAGLCAGGAIVALWSGATGVVPTALAFAPMVAIGQISYGLYLFHFPIGRRLALADLSLPGPVVVALKTALTLVVATASYLLVERRILRHKRRFPPGPRPTTEPLPADVRD